MKHFVVMASLFVFAACVDSPDASSTASELGAASEAAPASASTPAPVLEDPEMCTTGVPTCVGKPVNTACKPGPFSPERWCYVRFSDPNFCDCGDGSDA